LSLDHQDPGLAADDTRVQPVDHARVGPRGGAPRDGHFDTATELDLNRPERWVLTRVRTKGVTGLVLQLSLMAVLASVVLVTVACLAIWGPDDPFFSAAVIFSAAVPAVVAPPVLVFTVRLAERLDTASALLWTTARTDPLTGLRNRRAFFEALDLLATSPSGPADLGLVDIDAFKSINDRHGHLAGDRVLEDVGQWLAELAGPTGLVARVGGDEFALIVPSGSGRARPVAHCIVSDGVECTVSVGWQRWEPGDEPHAALHRADLALYRAKRGDEDSAAG
jgi:diguanylate cyclase (GGDEF)-like protein